MLNVWGQLSGTNLGTIEEGSVLNLTLPTQGSLDGISFTKISGNLPGGTVLINNTISGTVAEVVVTTDFTFVIRATKTTNGIVEVSDRTFKITVEGADSPSWVTASGLLPVGVQGSRTAKITSVSRTDGIVTAHTAEKHSFIFGNPISVEITGDFSTLNLTHGEVLRPPYLPDEKYKDYLTRTTTTVTFEKPGENIPETNIVSPNSGIIKLVREPLTFILDNTYVDFQLSAIDPDTLAGDSLEFFIEQGNGELPPGLTLSPSGRITGIVDPILALDISAGTGFFDSNIFDSNPFDFGEAPQTGLDSFRYDQYVYDFYELVKSPRKLNRNYEFIVTVSDGDTSSQRKFKIYVVGDDFLRVDNTIMKVDTGVFTADNTYLRTPIWRSASNLGVKRADNYVTVFLDVFDPDPVLGPLVYELETTNPDLSTSELPPGLFVDSSNGEIFGYVPYMPAVTKEYKFTVTAVKYDAQSTTEVVVDVEVREFASYGQHFLTISQLPSASQSLLLNENIRIGSAYYKVTSYTPLLSDPTKANLGLSSALLVNVPAETILTKVFVQSTAQFNIVRAPKTFVLSVLGEVDSVIKWTSNFDLGAIRVNLPSILSVSATTSVPNAVLSYKLVAGNLPPGLTLGSAGEIIGVVKQDATLNENKTYTFTILAEDQFKYSGILGTFTVIVNVVDDRDYSNIYVKPFQKQENRQTFFNFITDSNIFTPEKIYRLSDPKFGIQTELKMLIYAGIETTSANQYVAALSKNTKRKRFRIGSPKVAIANKYGSSITEYEVIYLEVFDEYENGTESVKSQIKLSNIISDPVKINQGRLDPVGNLTSAENQKMLMDTAVDRFRPINGPITVDSTVTFISSNDTEYVYPSSVSNIRNNIKNIQVLNRTLLTENEFLPLWMLTPQNNRTAATGFIKAIPLCYCKPGEGSYILANIKNSKFDFTSINYEIDRFIIDSTSDNANEQYLKFNNFKYNV